MADSGNQPERLISPGFLASLVLGGIVVLLAVWVRAGLVGGGHWPIEWLDVEGQLRRTSADQVRSVVSVHSEHGFFAVNLEQVRDAVEALPWVDSVMVSRRWPDALVVRVREHQPLVRWNESELISRTGEVFRVDGIGELQGLAHLRGPEHRRQEVFDQWVRMRSTLMDVGLDVDRLSLDPRGSWQADLNNGTRVKLGREELEDRLARFVAVADELRSRSDQVPALVDLRYTNGLAVRWPVRVAELVVDDHG